MEILITENQFRELSNILIESNSYEMQSGIDFVFNKNPLLASIGTKKQYEEYLNQFFPNSKFKDIVYHGSLKELKEIDKRYYITFWSTSLDYVMSSNLWKGNITAAIINTKNPMFSDKPLGSSDPELDPEITSPAYTPEEYDSVIGVDYGQEKYGGKTIAVKNKFAETHILGSDKDLKLFKKFTNKKKWFFNI